MEKGSSVLRGSFLSVRVPFLAGLLSGFAAHMFMLTNKLPNHDEIESIFGKGATVTSGRWGLEVIKPIFPDISMPWVYGLITLVLISIAVCIAVMVLEIRSPVLQAVCAALFTTFPSLTGTLCFMFTAPPYAAAFLASVLAVREALRGGWKRDILAGLLIVLCMSIYQAYIAVTAALLVLVMIRDCISSEKTVWQIVSSGLRYLAVMLLALAVYFGITVLVLRVCSSGFNTYVTDNVNSSAGIPGRILLAYTNFRDVFTFRNFYLISSEGSRYIHIILMSLTLVCVVIQAFRSKDALRALLLLGLTLILPLSINCMFLVMGGKSIHTLVLYSFVCVYLLCALIIECLDGRAGKLLGGVLTVMLCAVVLSNVYFANMTYLKMDLQLENAKSFYTGILARVYETEGFDDGCSLAVIGHQDNLLCSPEELDTFLLMGPSADLINIYSRENFFRLYLGSDIPFASGEEVGKIAASPEFEAMAEYPYNGSVGRIGECIVVKLG